MDQMILVTKLHIPAQQTTFVPRDRLFSRINQTRLTLLSAPTGFGKTTLLAHWADGQRVAWLSLDKNDNDPMRFLAYLVEALWRLDDEVGGEARGQLKQGQPLQTEPVLTSLINDLSRVHEPFTLVLDDYHTIEAPAVHRMVSFLIEQMPAPLSIVISSRTDPPLHLARMRARGEITELRAEDLRFSTEEMTAFLDHVAAPDLSAEDIHALEESTEGWIAGIQLAALSMRGRPDFREFIRTFSGGHRHILDYLAVEVLHKQPDDVQDFLLRTSLLNRLSGPLCDAVTGREDSRELLLQLERDNLFVVVLDEARRWYRYHHLFASFLREYLKHTDPDAIPVIHQEAADWFADNGLSEEAVGHALAAGDFERVLHLIDATAHQMWARGELATLVGWLEALPEHMLQDRPRLKLYHVWALATLEEVNAAEQPINMHTVERQRATANLSHSSVVAAPHAGSNLPGLSEAMQAATSALRGDTSRAVSYSRRALAALPEEDHLLRSIITLNLGFAYRDARDMRQAADSFEAAAQTGAESGNLYVAQTAMDELAQLSLYRGHMIEAASAYQKALSLARREGGTYLPVVCRIHMRLGVIHSEWNERRVAEHHLVEAVRLAKRFKKPDIAAHARLGLAMMHRCEGDLKGALGLVDTAEAIAVKHNLFNRVRLASALRARLWIAQGEVERANRWAWESGLSVDDETSYTKEFEHVTLARILIASNQVDDALYLLRRLYQTAENDGRLTGRIRALTGMALAYQRSGDLDDAQACLEEALAIAEPERYVYTFVEEGGPMAKLLMRILSQNTSSTFSASLEYIRRLLAVFGEARLIKTLKDQPLKEPLSDREMEVLRLMAGGMSNREIADELVISVGTAKWHTKNIYRKLNVHSRTQAIAYARDLNLIR